MQEGQLPKPDPYASLKDEWNFQYPLTWESLKSDLGYYSQKMSQAMRQAISPQEAHHFVLDGTMPKRCESTLGPSEKQESSLKQLQELYGDAYRTLFNRSHAMEAEIALHPVHSWICKHLLPWLEEFYEHTFKENYARGQDVLRNFPADATPKPTWKFPVQIPFMTRRNWRITDTMPLTIMRDINEQLLKPKGYMLAHSHKRFKNEDTLRNTCELYRIELNGTASTDDGIDVPYAFLHRVYPVQDNTNCDLGCWNGNINLASMFVTPTLQALEIQEKYNHVWIQNGNIYDVPDQLPYIHIMCMRAMSDYKKFGDTSHALTHHLCTGMLEEIRHGINAKRFTKKTGLRTVYGNSQWTQSYLDFHLQGGALGPLATITSTRLDDVVQKTGRSSLTPDEKKRAIRSIVEELNATVTSLAVGPCPARTIIEYEHNMQICADFETCFPKHLANLAIRETVESMIFLEALGEAAGFNIPWKNAPFSSYVTLGKALAKLPERTIRLLTKHWYDQTFTQGKIDEPPFDPILDEGTIVRGGNSMLRQWEKEL